MVETDPRSAALRRGPLLRFTKIGMLVVDIGFLVYWLATALQLIPPEYAFRNYLDPVMVDWNWSFLPLDLLASATGLWSLALLRTEPVRAKAPMLVSLAFTHAAGLQAIAFWVLQRDFSVMWWFPNLFLLLFPIPMIAVLLRGKAA